MAFRYTIRSRPDEFEDRVNDAIKRGFKVLKTGDDSYNSNRVGNIARKQDYKPRKSDLKIYGYGAAIKWAIMEKEEN